MKFSKIIFLAALLSFPGCAVMHSYSLTDPVATDTKGREITAEETTTTVLQIDTPVFPGNIQETLRKQCPDGRVVGTRSWLTMREWVLVQYYVLTANALCVASK